MADFTLTPLTDALLAHKKPITQELMRALRDNPIGIAEGADSAPRVALKTFGAAAASGSALTFTGLGQFQGVALSYNANNGGGSNRTPTIALSDDGSTFGTATNLPQVSANDVGSGVLFVDFATGNYKVSYGEGASASYTSGTIAGGGASVSAFRIVTETDLTIALTGWANGGESTT